MLTREDWKELFIRVLPWVLTLVVGIVIFFIFFRFDKIQDTIHSTKIIMTPFVYGGIMAFLLKTPCNFFEEKLKKWLPEKLKKKNVAITVFVIMFLVIGAVYLLLSFVLPDIYDSIFSVISYIPKATEQFTSWITQKLEGEPEIAQAISSTVNNISTQFSSWAESDLTPMLQNMMGGFASMISSIVIAVYDIIVGIVVCIYILGSRKRFGLQAKALIYAIFRRDWADKIMREILFIDSTFVGFFAGKLLDSAIIGGICYVFCLILSMINGFENGLLISVMIGVTNIIPYFGPFIGAIPAALIILLKSPVNCLIFLIFILILQQVDGNIIGPKLLAGRVGISGFWVLFSLTLFGGFWGFAGILIGVPLFAIIYDFVGRLVKKSLKKKKLEGILTGETDPMAQIHRQFEEEHPQKHESQIVKEKMNQRFTKKKKEIES